MLLFHTTKCHKKRLGKEIQELKLLNEPPQTPIDDIMADFRGLSLSKPKDKKKNIKKVKTPFFNNANVCKIIRFWVTKCFRANSISKIIAKNENIDLHV